MHQNYVNEDQQVITYLEIVGHVAALRKPALVAIVVGRISAVARAN